jgi:Mg2+/Co2+ transporter CorB
MVIDIIVITILLLVSGLFSASETAILNISRAKLHKLKNDGNQKATMLSKLREDKEGLIGTILLGNNFVNTAASSIATGVCISFFGSGNSALMIATLIMTVLILVLSEVMPKTYAVRNSETVALAVSPIISIIKKLLMPLVAIVRFVVNNFLKILAPSGKKIHISALESIKSTIDIHHQEGEVISDYKYMLSGVIELAEVIVKEVMVHRNECFSIDIELSPQEIIETAIQSPYSRIPLWQHEPDNVVAILHVKDISKIMLMKQSLSKITKSDIMSACRKPWFIPSTTTLNTQLLAFKARHLHFALAVNEYGELEGIVTLEDILEEVVGHIEDEHDISKNSELKIHQDGSVIAGGNVSIRDLNRAMQWELDDKNAHTIGGLLFHAAQGIPDIGQSFEVDNFQLKLIKKSKNKILKVKVQKIATNMDEENE